MWLLGAGFRLCNRGSCITEQRLNGGDNFFSGNRLSQYRNRANAICDKRWVTRLEEYGNASRY
jgi:hypothetical protein